MKVMRVNMEELQPKKKKFKLSRFFKKMLIVMAKFTMPYIYVLYWKFVCATSKMIVDERPALLEFCKKEPKIVTILWHQDVFCVAGAYTDFRPHTIASVGDAGAVIARILKLCKFTVFRGGSSKGGKSRRKKILEEFTEHIQNTDVAVVGITVDGSSGPVYKLKTGSLVVAMPCKMPVFCMRVWCKRRILLPTWDRTLIPLPFNEMVVLARGPYYLPENIEDAEVFSKFHAFIENELLRTAYKSFELTDKKINPKLLEGFPDGWTP